MRLPVVPGLNDSVDNVLNTARFVKNLGRNLLRLELLPYHQFGMHGYDELERSYALAETRPPSDDHMARLRETARSVGITVEIGG